MRITVVQWRSSRVSRIQGEIMDNKNENTHSVPMHFLNTFINKKYYVKLLDKSCPAAKCPSLIPHGNSAQSDFIGCVLLHTITVITVMNPILPFSRFPCGRSEWVESGVCLQPACLPGNFVIAHQRPLPWLNAAPSPRKSAGKDQKDLRNELTERSTLNRSPSEHSWGSPVKEAQPPQQPGCSQLAAR